MGANNRLIPVQPDQVVPARDPVVVYLRSSLQSEVGRETMLSSLRRAAELLTGQRDPFSVPWEQVTSLHLGALRQALLEHYTVATTNTTLAGVKGILKTCWRLGLMTHEEYARAVDVKAARGSNLPAGRMLDPAEIAALFTTLKSDQSEKGLRDATAFCLALGSGLRRAELISLRWEQVELDDIVTIRVVGKGRKERLAYLRGGGKSILSQWKDANPYSYVLIPITRHGQMVEGPISGQSIGQMMKKRAIEAGLDPMTPHDCRRTYISALFDSGVDIATAQRLAGHSKADTTVSYDRRPEQTARQAAGVVPIPW